MAREVDPSQAERALSWARTCPDPAKDRSGAIAAVRRLAGDDFDVHCHVHDLCYKYERTGAPRPWLDWF